MRIQIAQVGPDRVIEGLETPDFVGLALGPSLRDETRAGGKGPFPENIIGMLGKT